MRFMSICMMTSNIVMDRIVISTLILMMVMLVVPQVQSQNLNAVPYPPSKSLLSESSSSSSSSCSGSSSPSQNYHLSPLLFSSDCPLALSISVPYDVDFTYDSQRSENNYFLDNEWGVEYSYANGNVEHGGDNINNINNNFTLYDNSSIVDDFTTPFWTFLSSPSYPSSPYTKWNINISLSLISSLSSLSSSPSSSYNPSYTPRSLVIPSTPNFANVPFLYVCSNRSSYPPLFTPSPPIDFPFSLPLTLPSPPYSNDSNIILFTMYRQSAMFYYSPAPSPSDCAPSGQVQYDGLSSLIFTICANGGVGMVSVKNFNFHSNSNANADESYFSSQFTRILSADLSWCSDDFYLKVEMEIIRHVESVNKLNSTSRVPLYPPRLLVVYCVDTVIALPLPSIPSLSYTFNDSDWMILTAPTDPLDEGDPIGNRKGKEISGGHDERTMNPTSSDVGKEGVYGHGQGDVMECKEEKETEKEIEKEKEIRSGNHQIQNQNNNPNVHVKDSRDIEIEMTESFNSVVTSYPNPHHHEEKE